MNNYYKNLFLETVNNLQEKKSILLHSCCGPCSSYVIQYLGLILLLYIIILILAPIGNILKEKKNKLG